MVGKRSWGGGQILGFPRDQHCILRALHARWRGLNLSDTERSPLAWPGETQPPQTSQRALHTGPQRNLTELVVAVRDENIVGLFAALLNERRVLLTANKLSTVRRENFALGVGTTGLTPRPLTLQDSRAKQNCHSQGPER